MTEEQLKAKIKELQADALIDKTKLLAQKIDQATLDRTIKRLKETLEKIAEYDYEDIDDAKEIAKQALKEIET